MKIIGGAAAPGLVSALLLFPGCGGQTHSTARPSQAPKASPEKPVAVEEASFDLETAMRREATGLTARAVHGPGGAFSADVPALSEPHVSVVGDVTLVVIPIGPSADVRCQVHQEAVDPAGTLFGVLKESSARVQYEVLEPAGVQLVRGSPAAAIRAVYLADGPGGSKSVGGLKLAIHTAEERSLLCLLDDLGYEQTFATVSSAFFASFAAPGDAKTKATYTEVTKARIGEIDVGFGVTRILPGEKAGEREYHHLSTHLVPESPQQMSFDDAYTVLKLNAKGQVLNGNWAEASAGELILQLELKRRADGKYSYEGRVEGQAVQGTLTAPKGVATSLEVAGLLKKKLAQGRPFTETVAEYHPSIDPLATVDVSYSHAQGAPPRQVVMSLGERTFTADVDDDGMTRSGWFALDGNQKLSISREHLEGRL